MDEKIIPLVKIINNLGIPTKSSCQGHGLPLYLNPFVVFYCEPHTASNLSKLLRQDAESCNPTLHWEWVIDAGFDENHHIFFRLTIANPRKKWYKWFRLYLDADLKSLCNLVKVAF